MLNLSKLKMRLELSVNYTPPILNPTSPSFSPKSVPMLLDIFVDKIKQKYM